MAHFWLLQNDNIFCGGGSRAPGGGQGLVLPPTRLKGLDHGPDMGWTRQTARTCVKLGDGHVVGWAPIGLGSVHDGQSLVYRRP